MGCSLVVSSAASRAAFSVPPSASRSGPGSAKQMKERMALNECCADAASHPSSALRGRQSADASSARRAADSVGASGAENKSIARRGRARRTGERRHPPGNEIVHLGHRMVGRVANLNQKLFPKTRRIGHDQTDT